MKSPRSSSGTKSSSNSSKRNNSKNNTDSLLRRCSWTRLFMNRNQSSAAGVLLSASSSISTSTSALSSFRYLCSQWPILIVLCIASLDNADKQLLSSSFPILEKVVGWDVSTLGNFTVATNLSYALSLPLWGYCIHKCQSNIMQLQQLLSLACSIWGLATIAIAIVTCQQAVAARATTTTITDSSSLYYWYLQILTRSLNGIALGSILPLSQSLLAEYTPSQLRGQAFGLMSVGEKLAGTIASSSIIYVGVSYWQYVYYVVGVLSICMGVLASRSRYLNKRNPLLKYNNNKQTDTLIQDDDDDEEYNTLLDNNNNNNINTTDQYKNKNNSAEVQLSLRQIIERIIRLPAFMCLVAQGVFGGTPWDMMSFLLLLMDWRGFTKNQIVTIQITSGISSMLGCYVGGIMGDFAAAAGGGRRYFRKFQGSQGRIVIAFTSVVVGIPFYGLFLYETQFFRALVYMNVFQLIATWAPPAAIRPICAELTTGPSERAQIVALWILLEKLSGAVFGAPLVGYLTDRMLTRNNNDQQKSVNDKTDALAFNIFLLSTIFWSICAFFWFIMLLAIQRTPPATARRKTVSPQHRHNNKTIDSVVGKPRIASV